MSEITTVRMYKEETVCAHCGRYIKNVVEIDGTQYGTRCCEQFLPRHYSVKKGVVVVNAHSMIAEAKAILGETYVRFASQPTAHLQDYVQRAIARGAKQAEGVSLILAARSA